MQQFVIRERVQRIDVAKLLNRARDAVRASGSIAVRKDHDAYEPQSPEVEPVWRRERTDEQLRLKRRASNDRARTDADVGRAVAYRRRDACIGSRLAQSRQQVKRVAATYDDDLDIHERRHIVETHDARQEPRARKDGHEIANEIVTIGQLIGSIYHDSRAT